MLSGASGAVWAAKVSRSVRAEEKRQESHGRRVSSTINGVHRTAALDFFTQIRTMVMVWPSGSTMLGSSSMCEISDVLNSKYEVLLL